MLSHGNESTGFRAGQSLLRQYRDRELPRALSLFIANVAAARHGLRRLDDQIDYNRVWPGTDAADSQEARMMQQVVDGMGERRPFASLDVHNNTGINPHYACINRIDNQFLRSVGEGLRLNHSAVIVLVKDEDAPGAIEYLQTFDTELHVTDFGEATKEAAEKAAENDGVANAVEGHFEIE